jgi:hypothetical protein
MKDFFYLARKDVSSTFQAEPVELTNIIIINNVILVNMKV